MKEVDRRSNEEAVSVDQVSVNSADPLHSTFRGNYEYAFGVVMFESAPGRLQVCRLHKTPVCKGKLHTRNVRFGHVEGLTGTPGKMWKW